MMEFVQESLKAISGMYPFADACVPDVFDVLQYTVGLLRSLKSVPPTATLKGVEATPLTANPN
jgi:hypothetical protein